MVCRYGVLRAPIEIPKRHSVVRGLTIHIAFRDASAAAVCGKRHAFNMSLDPGNGYEVTARGRIPELDLNWLGSRSGPGHQGPAIGRE